jgi:hypothetical protein
MVACEAIDVIIAIGILKANRADAFCTSFLGIQTHSIISYTTTTSATTIFTTTTSEVVQTSSCP